jgi:hypothetical protein
VAHIASCCLVNFASIRAHRKDEQKAEKAELF